MMFGDFSSFISVAVKKYSDKKQQREKRVYLSYNSRLQTSVWGTSRQELTWLVTSQPQSEQRKERILAECLLSVSS